MLGFAWRTGLSAPADDRRRYLWTDAFAVCNFLGLFEQTGDRQYRDYAIVLLDQVHSVLGQYRADDRRRGWISGLDDEAARSHPTAGGLRIGKPLKERDAGDSFDEHLEWDRDGQYFHYLTKWMHALCKAASVACDAPRWAVELGAAAFAGFVRRSGTGEVVGIHWKMSTDLSRPLVPASSPHDALDGFITLREAQQAAAKRPTNAGTTDLGATIESLSALCRHRDWATDDPLGLGGLLFDACRLCQLIGEERPGDVLLLEEIVGSCCVGLATLLARRQLSWPLSHRLAFRELGLAIGLHALPTIGAVTNTRGLASRPALRRAVELLLPYRSLSEEIISLWLPRAEHPDGNWQAHQDINDVMLATALIPDMFLSIGQSGPQTHHHISA
jgi:hypothetical protein